MSMCICVCVHAHVQSGHFLTFWHHRTLWFGCQRSRPLATWLKTCQGLALQTTTWTESRGLCPASPSLGAPVHWGLPHAAGLLLTLLLLETHAAASRAPTAHGSWHSMTVATGGRWLMLLRRAGRMASTPSSRLGTTLGPQQRKAVLPHPGPVTSPETGSGPTGPDQALEIMQQPQQGGLI